MCARGGGTRVAAIVAATAAAAAAAVGAACGAAAARPACRCTRAPRRRGLVSRVRGGTRRSGAKQLRGGVRAAPHLRGSGAPRAPTSPTCARSVRSTRSSKRRRQLEEGGCVLSCELGEVQALNSERSRPPAAALPAPRARRCHSRCARTACTHAPGAPATRRCRLRARGCRRRAALRRVAAPHVRTPARACRRAAACTRSCRRMSTATSRTSASRRTSSKTKARLLRSRTPSRPPARLHAARTHTALRAHAAHPRSCACAAPLTRCAGAAPRAAGPPWKAIGLALLLLASGTLFLTLGVLALRGELNTPSKGTPRELVRAPPPAPRCAGTRADAKTLASMRCVCVRPCAAPHASARRVRTGACAHRPGLHHLPARRGARPRALAASTLSLPRGPPCTSSRVPTLPLRAREQASIIRASPSTRGAATRATLSKTYPRWSERVRCTHRSIADGTNESGAFAARRTTRRAHAACDASGGCL
jgi:hypothetical protein